MIVSYTFRARAALGTTVKIESPEPGLAVHRDGPVEVSIRPLQPGTPLTDSRHIAVVGVGYDDETQARADGERWRAQVMVAFARLGIGADFGERSPSGGFSDAYIKQYEATKPGVRLYNEAPGEVLVVPSEPQPVFGQMRVDAVVGKQGEEVVAAVQAAATKQATLSAKEQVAYNLYSGSFFMPDADARLMMLAMALETMIEQEQRPAAALTQLDMMVDGLRESNLDGAEKDSLIQSLTQLRKESIGRAGRRQADALGDRVYHDMRPRAFFNYVYKLRSALAHGHHPRPARDEVSVTAAHLEKFVGDLLGIALLDDFPH